MPFTRAATMKSLFSATPHCGLVMASVREMGYRLQGNKRNILRIRALGKSLF
jgi:hypothetical protein